MAAVSSKKSRPWFTRFLLVLLAAGLGMLALLVVGGAAVGSAKAVGTVSTFMNHVRIWLYAFQLAFIGLAWWRWEGLIHYLDRHGKVNSAAVAPLLAARHRIMGALLVVQLLVVMGLPFRNPFVG